MGVHKELERLRRAYWEPLLAAVKAMPRVVDAELMHKGLSLSVSYERSDGRREARLVHLPIKFWLSGDEFDFVMKERGYGDLR
jgi:hypothetical protein